MVLNGLKIYLSLKKTLQKTDEDGNKGYFLEVDEEYPKKVFIGVALNLRSDLAFLSERNKINKYNKLVHDKKNYVVHLKAIKHALNHGLILKTCTE